MPLWDGFTWQMWIEAPRGSIIEIHPVDAIHSNYVAKQPANDSDVWIEFIDRMWQQANWPEVSRIIIGIQDDFHLLATSIAKLNHIFETKDKIERALIGSFVRTELEYIITVSRSVFDLLQEALASIWNNRIKLLDPSQERIKNQHKLPDKFTKMAIQNRKVARPVSEMEGQYAISRELAETYHRLAPFYISLLKARDKIIHGGGSVETIFVTEKGFCVDRNAENFASFEWRPAHSYNDSLSSLLPWVANIVFMTIQSCNDIMAAFASVISMPPDIAPGYRVFIRDPANEALNLIANAVDKDIIWWSDIMRKS